MYCVRYIYIYIPLHTYVLLFFRLHRDNTGTQKNRQQGRARRYLLYSGAAWKAVRVQLAAKQTTTSTAAAVTANSILWNIWYCITPEYITIHQVLACVRTVNELSLLRRMYAIPGGTYFMHLVLHHAGWSYPWSIGVIQVPGARCVARWTHIIELWVNRNVLPSNA